MIQNTHRIIQYHTAIQYKQYSKYHTIQNTTQYRQYKIHHTIQKYTSTYHTRSITQNAIHTLQYQTIHYIKENTQNTIDKIQDKIRDIQDDIQENIKYNTQKNTAEDKQ